MRLVDLEAHFYTHDYAEMLYRRDTPPKMRDVEGGKRAWFEPSIPDLSLKHRDFLFEALMNLGEERVRVMDRFGISTAVASLCSPGVDQLEPSEAIDMARKTNDTLAEVHKAFPGRFIPLASLPCIEPEAAAEELERCISSLNFKGGNVHSHVHDVYLDDQRFRPIFERAASLGIPLNIHPTVPHANLIKPFLGYGWALPAPGLGFGVETAIEAMRLIYSGIFDEYPDLILMLGHLGESLTFWLYRLDFDFTKEWMDTSHRPDIEHRPSWYLRNNFYMTTSGNYLHSALLSVLLEVGADRIMFATDYPWERIEDAVNFLESAPISPADREKIAYRNADELFGLTNRYEADSSANALSRPVP